MTTNQQVFHPSDLVLVVWPRQSELLLKQGHDVSRQKAASSAWAMDADKADRVRVVVSVHEDTIIGAWAVPADGITNVLEAPEGKTRRVNRASFATYEDPRLHYLIGHKSPFPPRRNPRATMELRDLDGAELLLGEQDERLPEHGVVRLGRFTLTVREDGGADLTYPAGSPLNLRPVG